MILLHFAYNVAVRLNSIFVCIFEFQHDYADCTVCVDSPCTSFVMTNVERSFAHHKTDLIYMN